MSLLGEASVAARDWQTEGTADWHTEGSVAGGQATQVCCLRSH